MGEWLQYLLLYMWIGPSVHHLLSCKACAVQSYMVTYVLLQNRHHLIDNFHAKSLESCCHIIEYAPILPCCHFANVGKRRCLITAVKAWNVRRACDISLPIPQDMSCAGKYLRWLPTPKVNLDKKMYGNLEVVMTRTLVSIYSVLH